MNLCFWKREAKKSDKGKVKVKVSKVGRLTLALSILLVVAGCGAAYLGNLEGNPIIIGAGFFSALGGIILFLKTRESMDTRILPGGKRLEQPANALLIYKHDVEFDHIKKPPGHQQRCINDGKWYHVLTRSPEVKALTEFLLPDDRTDGRHYDPREFANPVTMPANQKLFEPVDSMFKTVAVGIMGLVSGGLAVVILAMVG